MFPKGMTFPLVILGIIAILTATATGLSENAGKIQLALGIFFLLPPSDYLFYRFRAMILDYGIPYSAVCGLSRLLRQLSQRAG